MTRPHSRSAMSDFSSSTLPEPNSSPGFGCWSGTTRASAITRSIASARPRASASRSSGECTIGAGRSSLPSPSVRRGRDSTGTTTRARSIERSTGLAIASAASSGPTSSSGSSSVCPVCLSEVTLLAFRRIRIHQMHGLPGHDRRYGMLIHELRVPIAPQKHAKVVEPRDDPLKLYAIDQEDRERSSCSCGRG